MNAALGVIVALFLFTGLWGLSMALLPMVAQFPFGALALVLAFRMGQAVEDSQE